MSFFLQISLFYRFNIAVASRKYVTTETISVSDEIIGLATSAGSIPTRLAIIGSMLPIDLAAITITSIDTLTVIAIKAL